VAGEDDALGDDAGGGGWEGCACCYEAERRLGACGFRVWGGSGALEVEEGNVAPC
jgi:hypothetical protein